MSDISINLDGLLTFAVIVLAAMSLSIGITGCFFRIRGEVAKHPGESRTNHRLVPHMIGMAYSLLAVLLIPLLLWVMVESVEPGIEIDQWLDHWILVWMGTALLPWPLTVLLQKRV